METGSRRYILPVFVLFLFSGMAGLAYEIVWMRMLVRSFGATSFAVSTVLASYMAGLALGSYLFGRMIDIKGRPILIYGLLELGIGAFALAFPFLLSGLNPLYRNLYSGLGGRLYLLSIIRFGLSFSMLLVPTTLMGGTLPILSRYVTRSLSNLTSRVGWLYSVNTFGAVAGTFATGFLVLPALGLRFTTYIAVTINMAIFLISLMLARTDTGPAPEVGAEIPHRVRTKTTGYEKVILTAFLFTGMAALSAEVLWTRVLTLVVGTTVYAFSIMLTVFLLGLALGSAVFARIAQRSRRPGTLFAVLVMAIGLVVFLSTIAFGRLPVMYMALFESIGKTWGNLVLVQVLLSLVIMIIPTFLMGGTFPLVARIYATDLSSVGARIGTAYAFNTIGSILGSFIGSFVLLNFLGIEKGILTVAWVYLAVGMVLFWVISERMMPSLRLAGTFGVSVLVVLMALFLPGWDRKMMTSGVYIYGATYEDPGGLEESMRSRIMLFYDEEPGATVSLELSTCALALRIDGKVDASNKGDMITQELIAHLPLLLHERPDTVLVIGLGSGVTLGSALRHDIEQVDCVELLRGVIEAAGFYSQDNYDCLSDPRVDLIHGDGRNHVLLTRKRYDVIISEPTNPWISGVGDLFTLEFFREARAHLKPDGVMCAWVQIYNMGEEELRATLKSFVSVFPRATLWLSNESDIILIGSLSAVEIGPELLETMRRPAIRQDLERVQIDEPTDLLSSMLLDEEDLEAFAYETGRIHTDDNMLVEFRAGRRILESTQQVHLANFLERLRPYDFPGLDVETNRRIRDQVGARKLALAAMIEMFQGKAGEAVQLFEQSYQAAPYDQFVAASYVEIHKQIADRFLREGDYDSAIEHYRLALAHPEHYDAWQFHEGLATSYLSKGLYDDARINLETSLEANPYNAPGHYNLGQTLVALGDTLGAMRSYERALDLDPKDAESANNLAWFYAVRLENLTRALDLAKMAADRSRDAGSYDTLGWVYYKMGRLDEARRELRRALEIDPERAESIYHLAIVHHEKGEDAKARDLLNDVRRLDRGGVFGEKAGVMLNAIEKD